MRRAGVLVSMAKSAISRTTPSLQSVRHFSSRQLPAEARRLEGKVAIITGGASGIGEETTRLFVSHGARVIIADIQRDLGSKLASSLGPQAQFFPCNVAEEEEVGALVEFALARHGHLDIMFNNAAICREENLPMELDMEGYRTTMAVNVQGPVLGVKYASRAMIERNEGRGGSILITASLGATFAPPPMPMPVGMSSYTISKHAVVGLMKSAASDLAPFGIRVNCVSPTVVNTPLSTEVFQKRAPGVSADLIAQSFVQLKLKDEAGGVKPQDMAHAALFLSSDEARFISGQDLKVDGAYSVCKGANLG